MYRECIYRAAEATKGVDRQAQVSGRPQNIGSRGKIPMKRIDLKAALSMMVR